MAKQTPASERAEQAIAEQFPDVRFGGRTGPCRKVRDSENWSQHAWGNALDLHASRSTLDVLVEWLEANRAPLSIRNLCYRDRGPCNRDRHRNHIHIDFNPRGVGTPPCAGGDRAIGEPATGIEDDDAGLQLPNLTDPFTSLGDTLPNLGGIPIDPAGPLGSVLGRLGLTNPLELAEAGGAFFTALLDPSTWVRILSVLGGVLLAAIALVIMLRELSGRVPLPAAAGRLQQLINRG